MTHLIPRFIGRFSTALLLTSVLSVGALAQSLPDISPDQIADDVERRYNERTGATEYVAASFDPFENERYLAGSAYLRSADEAITINGDFVEGGAFLDITAVYTANSADSFDVRGFEQVDFLSGTRAGLIRYDRETLDCSRSTNAITYDDEYYRGASYGYVAGLYRLYPRYRGHRHYGWTRHSWNRGIWGDWRRDRALRRHIRDHRRRQRARGIDRHHDSDSRPGRRHRGNHNGWRDRRDHNSDRDRRRRRHADGANPRGPRGEEATPRPRRNDDSRTRGPRRNGPETRDRNRERERDRVRDRERDTPRGDRRVRRDSTPRVRTPRTNPPTSRPPRMPRVRNDPPRNNSPKVPRNRPAVQTVKTPPPPKSRPRRPARSERPTRVNRATDRAFKNRNSPPKTGKAHRRFYPMVGGYSRIHTDVAISYRCVKEERLTVHIPQNRLDAARFDGLTLMMVDNAGREVPLFVPPNYIEGYRRAAVPAARADYGYDRYNEAPAPRVSAPRVSAPSAPLPSSREPIIYGDPGYPQ